MSTRDVLIAAIAFGLLMVLGPALGSYLADLADGRWAWLPWVLLVLIWAYIIMRVRRSRNEPDGGPG